MGLLRVDILGRLRLRRDGVDVDTGPRQQTFLLGLLLARAGQPVSTDELIDLLSTNLEPVDRRRPSRHLAGAVGIGTSAALGLMFATLGMRHDLANTGTLLFLALKLLFAGIVLGVAINSLSKAMRAGGERTVSLAAVWLPFIAIIFFQSNT